MDVILGPWTAAQPENKPLAEAMGDEAWKTVEKTAGFTPKQAPPGRATKGYTISGRLTSVVKEGRTTQIASAFTIWVDGNVSNVPPLQGTGFAEGSNTAEDALRAITESKVKQMLQAIKTGRVVNPR